MPRARPETTASPAARQLLGELFGDALAVRRGVAAADQRDRARASHRLQMRRAWRATGGGVFEQREQRRVVGCVEEQQPRAEPPHRLDLARRLAGRDSARSRAAAGAASAGRASSAAAAEP